MFVPSGPPGSFPRACDVGEWPRRGCRDFDFNVANLRSISAIAYKPGLAADTIRSRMPWEGVVKKATCLSGLVEDEIWGLVLEEHRWGLPMRRKRDC